MADPEDYVYTLDLEVRDYECDMESIVNNAVYLNYLEHARHEFLKMVGVDFGKLTERGIHPVVVRAEVDYRNSLRSGDRFWIGVNVERVSMLRIAFVQDIYRTSNTGDSETGHNVRDDVVAQARIITAVISASGRPVPPEELDPRFAELIRK